MKKMDFARYAVLGIFAVVGFVSCEKKENEALVAPSALAEVQTTKTARPSLSLNATTDYAYKTAYVHKPHDYGILAGFCAGWNAIKSVDYLYDNSKPSLTITQMIQDLGVTPNNPVSAAAVVQQYSWTGAERLNIYTNGVYSVEDQVGQAFDNYLMRPMLVLIRDYNSTLGKYENAFAVVFTYSGGVVYYASPFTRGNGVGLWDNLSSASLSDFVQKAQSAIDGANVRVMKF